MFRNTLSRLLISLLLLLIPCQVLADVTVGIFPRRSATITKQAFTPFIEELSAFLGEPVKLAFSPDMETFRDRYHNGDFDLAHLAQSHYVLHREHGIYRIICANVEFGNEKTTGILMARRDSNINSITDLKGKQIILCKNRLAMGCYTFPAYLLKQAGMEAGRDYTLTYAKSGPGAIIATYYKQADAAGAGKAVLQMESTTSKIDMGAMKIIAETEPVCNLPWVISTSMDKEKAARIRDWMLNLDSTTKGQHILRKTGIDRFAPVEKADYDVIAEILTEIK